MAVLARKILNSSRPYNIYYFPYIIPFTLFALFIYVPPLAGISRIITYPVQTIIVAISLIYYWSDFNREIRLSFDWFAVLSGVVVFFTWILPEGLYPQIGHSEFNPYELGIDSYMVYFVITFRMIGATVIVPLMEEIFWRSFALRFVIQPAFKSIPLGQFSWFSFIFVSVIFGFEHHRWLVGIIAGMVYAGLLYRRKNLFDPILSHSVTNLLLGIYILHTREWSFW